MYYVNEFNVYYYANQLTVDLESELLLIVAPVGGNTVFRMFYTVYMVTGLYYYHLEIVIIPVVAGRFYKLSVNLLSERLLSQASMMIH